MILTLLVTVTPFGSQENNDYSTANLRLGTSVR